MIIFIDQIEIHSEGYSEQLPDAGCPELPANRGGLQANRLSVSKVRYIWDAQ